MFVWSEMEEERRGDEQEDGEEGDDMMAMVMGMCALLRNWTNRWRAAGRSRDRELLCSHAPFKCFGWLLHQFHGNVV